MRGRERGSTIQRRGRGVGVEARGGTGEIMIRVVEGVVMIEGTTIGIDTDIGIDMMKAVIGRPVGTMTGIGGRSHYASSSFQSGVLSNGHTKMYGISHKECDSSITSIHHFTGCEIPSHVS
jgi:hypothetical protein